MIEFQPGESTQRVVRRHWLALLPEILIGLVFFFFPFGVSSLLNAPLGGLPLLESSLALVRQNQTLLTLALLLYYLIFLAMVLAIWMDYYLDILIVTDQRLLVVEQKGMFHRQVTAVPKERIQDITVRKRGILQHLFDFGDFQIQTAGEENYTMKDVPHPNEAKNFILQTTKISS